MRNDLYHRLRTVRNELLSIRDDGRAAFRAVQRDDTPQAEIDAWLHAGQALNLAIDALDHAASMMNGREGQ